MSKNYVDYMVEETKNILAIDSPSGYTNEVADYVMGEYKKLGYEPKLTVKGGVLVPIGGRDKGNAVLLEAHIDTLGAMVAEIKANGRLRVTAVGGMNANNAEGENCKVVTRFNGKYDGTLQLINASIHVNGEYNDTKRSYDSVEVVLDEKETGGSLFERLSGVGAKLCVRTLEAIEDGTAIYTKQDHAAATKTTLIKKQFGIIDWNKPAAEIECLIRGLNPWPSAYTYLNGKTLKIWAAAVKDETSDKEPGELTEVTKHSVGVQTGDGILMLEEVQLEGKKRMSADAFLRGNALSEGMKLGE